MPVAILPRRTGTSATPRPSPTCVTVSTRSKSAGCGRRRRANYRALIRRFIRPELGTMKVAAVDTPTLPGCIARSPRAARPSSPTAAWRCCRGCSRWRSSGSCCTDNPAKGIERNHEEKRERYLSDDELERLQRALDAHADRQAADILRLLLLTGARKGEVQSAEWGQFDLVAGVWTKPASHTKQERVHRVPLSPQALALLKALRKAAPKDARYAVSRSRRRHRVINSRELASDLTAAGIANLRMHDLRHSYASSSHRRRVAADDRQPAWALAGADDGNGTPTLPTTRCAPRPRGRVTSSQADAARCRMAGIDTTRDAIDLRG